MSPLIEEPEAGEPLSALAVVVAVAVLFLAACAVTLYLELR